VQQSTAAAFDTQADVRLTDAGFLSSELSIDPRYEVEQVPSAIALVKAGPGITALPSLTFTMFKDRELAVQPLIDPVMRRNVGFLTRQQRRLPAFLDELKYVIRKRLQHDLSSAQC
jgi:LysR family carnitine catabolism transcriptional activator